MQKHHLTKRLVCFMLSAILLLSIFVVGNVPANAGKVTKTEKRYEIAVVFDNSGSMYEDESWCQAKYAMEIFASMLNYDNGDKLNIFPMWQVTTDGSKPKTGGSYEPIEISGKKDIDKISNLFTVYPAGTPYAPVTEAYDYLKSVNGGCEKWLIVLTDGEFNNEAREESADINLQDRLPVLASDEIHVQYLGFGKAKELKEDSAYPNFHAKKSTAVSLKEDLIEVCNSIFQRTVLENALDGSKLELDMSMRKIIVFAQGANAKIVSLENAKGDEIKKTLDSDQRKYSTIKANDYTTKSGVVNPCSKAPVDKTLAGQVVTFAACKKGNYTLNVTGAEKVQIFYEPDVDIHFEIKKNAKKIDLSKGRIVAGKYNAHYSLVDRVTGEDVTMGQPLMGKVSLMGTIIDSNGKQTPFESGKEIDLQPDAKIYFNIEGQYLNDYTITTDSDKKGFEFEVIAPEEKLEIDAECREKGNWYNLQKKDEWKPIYVSLTVNDKPVSDEKLKSMKLDFNCSKDLTYTAKMLPGESAYEIYVGKNEKGEFVKPENGIYTISVKGSYVDKYDRPVDDKTSTTFEIQPYSQIWRWLIYVVIFAILLALFLLFMSRKVLPRKRSLVKEKCDFYIKNKRVGGGDFNYDPKNKTLKISSMKGVAYESECKATFKLYPVDKRWTRSKNRGIGVCDVTNVSMGVTSINLDSTPLDKKNGKFVVRTAPDEPMQEIIKKPTIRIDAKGSYLEISFDQK